jgi:hypothetical protein
MRRRFAADSRPAQDALLSTIRPCLLPLLVTPGGHRDFLSPSQVGPGTALPDDPLAAGTDRSHRRASPADTAELPSLLPHTRSKPIAAPGRHALDLKAVLDAPQYEHEQVVSW